MYEYIKGIITNIESDHICLENNNIGYLVYTSNPHSFVLNEIYKVYIFQNIKEDENTLYGFKTLEEKTLFLKLIGVKGVGCKMALPMLALGEVSGIADAIERENILYLKKFPKIGDKVARQIILDLKGKLVANAKDTLVVNEELSNTLRSLGYKQMDINKIIPLIKETTIENQVKEALKLLLK